MKKKATSSKSKTPGKLTAKDFGALIAEVRGLIQSARHAAATTVNTLQVLTNFEIGRRIVEHEQRGAARAEYGKELLKELSAQLTEEFGNGFSERNLRSFRSFYRTYQERSPQIWQKPSAKLASEQKSQKLSGELAPAEIAKKSSGKSPFALSWSHYVLLLTIKNPEERSLSKHPKRTPPSVSSSANKRNKLSWNSPSRPTPTSTPKNTSFTSRQRSYSAKNSSTGPASTRRAHDAGDVFREVRF